MDAGMTKPPPRPVYHDDGHSRERYFATIMVVRTMPCVRPMKRLATLMVEPRTKLTFPACFVIFALSDGRGAGYFRYPLQSGKIAFCRLLARRFCNELASGSP